MADSNPAATRPSLLGRIRDAGDWESWRHFYAQYQPMIQAWCRRWHLQDADAEEAASCVWDKLSQRMQSFQYDPSLRFRAWLRTIVENQIKDLFERKARRPGDYSTGMGPAQEALQQIVDPSAAAAELADELEKGHDRQAILSVALERVRQRSDARTWQAFERTALQDADACAVAVELGMGVASVYQAKTRVLKRIRDEVDRLDSFSSAP